MRYREISIGQNVISEEKVFIIAEIGINHNGNLGEALKLVTAAAESGADAVKFQTFHTDRLMVESRERYEQQADDFESAFQLFQRCELSWEDHEKIKSTPTNTASFSCLLRLMRRASIFSTSWESRPLRSPPGISPMCPF
ncbi:MAG: N-acetylneuraminate synthase family protein [Comamonadaceae bacterium]|nr:N-acetylneuraminate synthase family protein [Comamonadaceae bacterium]